MPNRVADVLRRLRIDGRAMTMAGLLASALAGFDGTGAAEAADPAEAASKPPVHVGIFVASRTDVCHDPGDVDAIKRLTAIERDRINQQGGIGGRKLVIDYYDDKRNDQRAVANVRTALAQSDTLALIGISQTARGKAVFDAVGPAIKDSGIPFISDVTDTKSFAEFPNVYTTRASQDDERLPVLIEFMKSRGARTPVFVGLKDNVFSTLLSDGLRTALGPEGLVADHKLTVLKDETIDPAELAVVIEDLKQRAPDQLFLSVGTTRTKGVLEAMMAAGITPPVVVTARLEVLGKDLSKPYPNSLYQIAWDQLPEVYKERLRRRIDPTRPQDWVFEGRKIASAPGWASGECKERPVDDVADPLVPENIRALGIGAQYADMVALVAHAARAAKANSDVKDLHQAVLRELSSNYVTGAGVFRGGFENWSFRSKSRAAARMPFIVQIQPDVGRPQLAPVQYVRLRNDVLKAVNTLYLDIDMTRIYRVDDSEKSFFAEFYLSMRDDAGEAGIDQIEFANAFLDPRTNDRQLTVRTLNKGGRSDAYPDNIMIYQVSGKFMFDPGLENYPFDQQRFSIDIRPKSGDAPFIVQPPPDTLRDRGLTSDGWDPKLQYVGYDEDFVQTIDARNLEQSIVPFYKASFVWTMSREAVDYYLRVVVPLAFILIVAYLSIFIPQSHFEAIVTIQVTALLSAVALYIALPQIDADSTTLSDRIFVFTYMAVSLMIGLSILRMNEFVAARPRLQAVLGVVHVAVIPIMVAAMALYIHRISTAAL